MKLIWVKTEFKLIDGKFIRYFKTRQEARDYMELYSQQKKEAVKCPLI